MVIDMRNLEVLEPQETVDITKLMKILADENRLKIISCLGSGEKCVCQLTEAIEISQNLMSHHLKVLKTEGLVTDERRGRWVYYSLKDKRLNSFLGQAGKFCNCSKPVCP